MYSTEEKINHINKVAKVYNETLSLTETGKKLNLSKERVRQVLLEGKNKGLINYSSPDQEKNKTLMNFITRYSKNQIIELLKTHKNSVKALKSIGANKSIGKEIIKHYNITKNDYHIDKFKAKYIAQYMQLLEKTGHHPSTTELQSSNKLRTLYNALCKYWGGIKAFRAEFGVTKENHFMTKEGYINWLKSNEKSKQTKHLKVINHKKEIVQLLNENNFMNRVELGKSVNLSQASISKYLNRLEEETIIKHSKLGNKMFYSVNLTNPDYMLYLRETEEILQPLGG